MLKNEQATEMIITMIKISQGNLNAIGNYVKSALYILIVNPTTIPTTSPTKLPEKTKLKAS